MSEKTNNKLLEVIRQRWSPRAFDADKKVDKVMLNLLFEAARWSASSFNEQPWRFIVGIKEEGYNWDKIYESLGEFNQVWAKRAPVLILACGKKHFSHNATFNKHHAYDVGQAIAQLSLQATKEGLYVHQMAGFSAEKAAELLSIPEEYAVLTAVAIGFKGNAEQLPENLRKREGATRERKTVDSFVFYNELPDTL